MLWALQIFTILLLPAFKNIVDYLASWIAKKSLENYKGEQEEENLISFSLNHMMGTVSFPTNMRFKLPCSCLQLSCCGVFNFTDLTNSQAFQATKLNLQVQLFKN